MVDLRPSFASVVEAFGLPAVVTLPDAEESIETDAVWLPSTTEEVPASNSISRAEEKRVLCLSKADVPQVPRGTLVAVAEYDGGDVLDWIVDAVERVEFDNARLIVLPVPVSA
jgi:hypothetical protein